MTKTEFQQMIQTHPIFLDGATGSNLMNAGMPMGCCPETWILEHKEVLCKLQRDYVEAGTNILYAPTFTANRIKLEEYGLENQVEELNHQLVELSREAAGGKALIAGDLTMCGKQLYPMGDMRFEELVEVYKEQIQAIERAGVDLYVVETMMSLQETRAALIALKELTDKPVMVSMTYQEDGRTLYGTDPVTATVVLQSLGADVIGLNCSTGPEDMVSLVKQMAEYATVPILAKPNAGLPELEDGVTVYKTEPEEFAKAAKKLVEAGAAVLGGCCGTTPKHIQALVEMVGDMPIHKPLEQPRRMLTSERKSVEIDLDGSFLVIGERINPTGKKKLQTELREDSLELVLSMAREQEEKGAAILDINMGLNGIDEKSMMLKTIEEVSSIVDCPLCIDSSYVEVIEEALRIYPGRALINSISLEKEKFEKLLPVAKKYGVELRRTLTGFKFIGEQIGKLEKQGKADSYVFGFEESYGYLTGSYVRDKDGVDGAYMICEMFSYYATKGISLLDKLDELYKTYGYCLNTLHSYEFDGSAGFAKMQSIMQAFRGNIKAFGGKKVVKLLDYAYGLDGLPKSEVLKFLLEDNCSIVVRPSGTEPKLKIYISVSAENREAAEKVECEIVKDAEKWFA